MAKKVSQSLPNQVNDFNTVKYYSCESTGGMSQSLPNQVNDFNWWWLRRWWGCWQRCRNPFQTRSTTSIIHEEPGKNDLEKGRNPFQTRSTTSIRRPYRRGHMAERCRNPFQTRSTTSIRVIIEGHTDSKGVAIPSKPGQRLQYFFRPFWGKGGTHVAIPSKPGQRLQFFVRYGEGTIFWECRNPFQTRSTTSIKAYIDVDFIPLNCRNPFQTRSTTSICEGDNRRGLWRDVAIPSKPGQRLQWEGTKSRPRSAQKKSQSLPNQVNDFNKDNYATKGRRCQ